MAVRPLAGRPEAAAASRRVETFGTRSAMVCGRHGRHDARPQWRRPAAPQIGSRLQVVIFGLDANPRYPSGGRNIRAHNHELGDRAERKGLGEVPFGPAARSGRVTHLRYAESMARSANRSHRQRIPRERGEARSRSPSRHSISDAYPTCALGLTGAFSRGEIAK